MIAAWLCIGAMQAQMRLEIRAPGLPLSRGTYSHKLNADGSKLATMTMELASADGHKVHVRLDRVYAADGKPVRAFSETVGEKPRFRRVVTVEFDDAGARAVIDESGKRTVKAIALAPNAPRESVSEFWFLRDKPKIGQSTKAYYFDVSTLEWTLQSSTYVGPTQIKLNGTQISGHRIKTDTGEAIVDDKGLPLRITMGAIEMYRIST